MSVQTVGLIESLNVCCVSSRSSQHPTIHYARWNAEHAGSYSQRRACAWNFDIRRPESEYEQGCYSRLRTYDSIQ